VAVLGVTGAENRFPDQDPVGQSLRINRVPFTIIGVLESKGESGPGVDQDDTVLLPLSTANKRVLGGSFAMSVFSQWKTLIDPTTVLLSFSFSAAVGIFFGFYTARKASQLDPIEALRHESPLGNHHFVLRHYVLCLSLIRCLRSFAIPTAAAHPVQYISIPDL
jgi:ABC-type antimicrobial peptide transport system permease subunit